MSGVLIAAVIIFVLNTAGSFIEFNNRFVNAVVDTVLFAVVEFGDGIMSAIDFDLDLTRQPDPNGDRVTIVMTGKFLKYKKA